MKILKVFLSILALVIKAKSQDSETKDGFQYIPDGIQYPNVNFRPTRVNLDSLNNNKYMEVVTASNIVHPPNINLEPPHFTAAVTNNVVNSRDSTSNPVPLTNEDQFNDKRKEQSFALMNFGLNLIADLNAANPGVGVIVSPLSIAGLLALILQGAVGKTRWEISRVLNMEPEDAAGIFKRVGEILKKRNSYNIYESANNIFISNAFEVENKFKLIATNSFGSEITQMSFADPMVASLEINTWVAHKTRNKIREIVNPAIIDQNTDIVLVNALYFKGVWQKKFNVNATVPRSFTLASGESKMTPFMRTRSVFKRANDPRSRSQIIVLPFEGEDYSLLIAMPTVNTTLDFTLNTFMRATLRDYKFTLRTEEIDLQIPKFIVKSNVDLKPILQKFLIRTFSDAADFSEIGSSRHASPMLSSAVHSAVLSIDENGATAAAATSFAAIALINDEVPIIKIDRPFLAVVWDNKLSIPIFVGRVEDPST